MAEFMQIVGLDAADWTAHRIDASGMANMDREMTMRGRREAQARIIHTDG